MKIQKIIVGFLKENCYLLEKNGNVLIIDPGDEIEKILEKIKGNIVGILITHYHFDHIGALNSLKNDFNVPIYDYKTLGKHKLKDFNFEIISTKGHSRDSITIYFKEENIMFCGDFIFKNSIGRTDLETGNMKEMQESIKNILTYDENIILYPGHYEKTTLKNEKDFLIKVIAE